MTDLADAPTWVASTVTAAMTSYVKLVGSWDRGTVPSIGPRIPTTLTPMGGEYPLDSRAHIKGLQLADGHWVGLHHYYRRGPCDHVIIEDCDLQSHQKWASRSYAMRAGNIVMNSAFRDVYTEHGIYWNIHGYAGSGLDTERMPALILRRSIFENLGSQGVQFVQHGRANEYLDPDEGISPGGEIRLRGNLFRNVGYNRSGNARASFAMSFFRSLNNVDVKGCMVDNSGQATSRGALLCEAREKFALSGSVFLTGVLQQPMIQVEEVENVHIENCFFHAPGGQTWLSFENCRNVTVTGCTGNMRIKVDGEDRGAVTEGISIQ